MAHYSCMIDHWQLAGTVFWNDCRRKGLKCNLLWWTDSNLRKDTVATCKCHDVSPVMVWLTPARQRGLECARMRQARPGLSGVLSVSQCLPLPCLHLHPSVDWTDWVDVDALLGTNSRAIWKAFHREAINWFYVTFNVLVFSRLDTIWLMWKSAHWHKNRIKFYQINS